MAFRASGVRRSDTLLGDHLTPAQVESLSHEQLFGLDESSVPSSVPSVPSSDSGATRSSTPEISSNTPAYHEDDLSTPVFRDSFDSIADDPFFQRFKPAREEVQVDLLLPPETPSSRNAQSLGIPAPASRKKSLSLQNPNALPCITDIMETVNIAIIGANGVGKSHFIERAMSLPGPPTANPITAKLHVENVPYAVTLLELDLEYFDVEANRQIMWPKQVSGAIMPRVDGVLLLYDITNRESLNELPRTLNALVNSSLPAVLVANKCDAPDNLRQIDTETLSAAGQSCLATFKTSASKPESAKIAFFTLLRALVLSRQEADSYEGPGSRRRAASAAQLEAAQQELSMPRPISQHSRHSRASSDMSLLRNYFQQGGENRNLSRSPRPSTDLLGGQGQGYFSETNEDGTQTVSSLLRTTGVRLDRGQVNTFLDVDDSDVDSVLYSEDIPILQRSDEMVFDRPVKKVGISLDELIDRLIAPKMSRADNNFSDVFLCLYRKFAAPVELFSALLSRLDHVKEDRTVHYLTKTSMQLRIIEVIAKWVAAYPGDFGRPSARKTLDDFVRHLSTEPIFAAASQQMRRTLDTNVVEDDDTGWVKAADQDDSQSNRDATRGADYVDSISALSVDDSVDRRTSATSSTATDYSTHVKTHSFQHYTYEDYEREAARMVPTSTLPLTKFRYHIFMDTGNADIADEITRIDWVMFSSIRIRDLVRHVSLSADQKEKCRAMRNVNRMINHFNHVAKWVSNMILMRDKPKHRAQMLEKFMNIALKLRQLNNYNGLAAVLAGINGTAVHRLAQTRALVSPEVHKRFARLGLLMGTQKSYFAYRLAWENSPLPRIPFIPLHRRDLVSAEEGSMTLVGPQSDRINWKKFEILGEVLLPIMKSQSTPYKDLSRNDTAREIILDCLMPTDEEEIYQRSVQVESVGGSSHEFGKKKFPWFAKQ
jgi:GTPase SAR1 family protein